MSVGSGRLGFRFPPPHSRPRWGSGEGKLQVQAAPGFFPLRPPAGEPPPRPAAASSERGDPAAVHARRQPAPGTGTHSLRLPSGGSARCCCRGEGRGAGDVLLLLLGVGAAVCQQPPTAWLFVRACVCVQGGVPGHHRRLYLFTAVTSSSFS